MKRMVGPLAGIPCLFLLASGAFAQQAREEVWKKQMEAASQALKENRPSDALMAFQAAMREAEKFGAEDPLLASTLLIFGKFCYSQNQFLEATTLIKRSLLIREANLGVDHPEVANTIDTLAGMFIGEGRGSDDASIASTLGSLAEVLRKTDRAAEAESLDARAQAVRAKQRAR